MPDTAIGYVILEGIDMEPNAKILSHDKGTGKVTGFATFQEAEKENRNGRCYMTSDLAREIKCPRSLELLKSNTFYSEWCHPAGDMVRQQTIDPKCAVARILSLEMNGTLVQGTFCNINTPLGLGFRDEMLDGVMPAWSLRALGCLENIKGRNVVTNLKMVTYDSVVFPSHDVAYTQKIVSESAGFKANERTLRESGELVPIMNSEVMSYIKNESANISRILQQIDVFYESVALSDDKRHVRMVAKNGDIFMVNLESYIQDELMNYAINH